MPMDFEPDNAFQYSNTGYVLLGEVITRYRAGNFEDILEHLNLKNYQNLLNNLVIIQI